MELDDLKNTWKETKSGKQEQQLVNPEMLGNVYNQKYRSKLKQITIPEIAGSIVCLGAAGFIGLSFYKLDTMFLQAVGVVTIVLLLLLPIVSYMSTKKLSMSGELDKPHASVLKDFAKHKIRFIQLQKLNVTLSYLLLVTTIVLLSKLVGGNDLYTNKQYWLFSFTIGFVLLMFYSRWVEKYYKKTLNDAEELLDELSS